MHDASSLLLYQGAQLAGYGFGQGHPFGPDRHDVFIQEAEQRGLLTNRRLQSMPPQSCQESDLALFHEQAYIDRVKRQSVSGEGYLDYADTPAFKGVYEAACYVVGSVLDAVEQLMRGRGPRAFIPIAGLHHASRSGAAGFCVFNDIGVACEVLRLRHGISKIAYIDIDAHHGDGVYYGFDSDPNVFIVDAHEDGRYLYPGTGSVLETGVAAAKGSKLNIPLPPGCEDEHFDQVWTVAESFLEQHPADFYILQCGADSIAGDPITDLRLTPNSHRKVARYLCQLSAKHAQGRLLALGGGGYNRHNIAKTWCGVVEQMLHYE